MFSGAGGLDLAVEAVFGGRTVWHCEQDPAASKVLAYRWPGVPNLGDITAVDWSRVEPVDVLCGGFPCQDVSAAGRRAAVRKDPAVHAPSWNAVRSIMARQDTLRSNAIGEARRKASEEANAEIQRRVAELVQFKQGVTSDVKRAQALVKALSDRRTCLPLDAETELVDAICEVLAGRRLLEQVRGIARSRLRDLESAMAALKKSWQYKGLTEALTEAESDTPRPEVTA